MSRYIYDNGPPALDGDHVAAMRDLTIGEADAITGGWCFGISFVWGDSVGCIGVST